MTLSAAVGLQRARLRRHHLRRDPPRVLEAARAARGHGRQPRRGRRCASPTRCPGSAARRSTSANDKELGLLCVQGLQRLDHRRVVRRRRARAADPADHRPAVGPRAGRRRDPPLRGQGQLRRSPSRRTRTRSVCPSMHDKTDHWDPVFQACQETRTTLCMHIGSSSKMPSTSPDAPFIISSTLTFQNAMGSLLDYIFSGHARALPRRWSSPTRRARSGWMPYVLERADKLWEERSDNSFGSSLRPGAVELRPRPRLRLHLRRPRSACATATSSAWTRSASRPTTRTPTRRSPTRRRSLADICTQAGLDEEETYKFTRGNAIRRFGLERFGITV